MYQSNQQPKRRDVWIDAVKGIAILSVIIGHIDLVPLSQVGLAFQLPLFAIISGSTFHPKDAFIIFFRKKAFRFILPYVVAFSFGFVVWLFLHDVNPVFSTFEFSLPLFISQFILGANPVFNAPLWFLPAFLLSLCIWYVIRSHKILWIFFLLIASYFVSKTLYTPSNSPPVFLSFDLALLLAAYIGIGSLCTAKIREMISMKLFLFCATLVFILGYHFNGSVNFYGRNFGHSILLFDLNNLTGSFFIISLVLNMETRARKVWRSMLALLAWLGRRSLALLLYHWPMLLILNSILEKTGVLSAIHATQLLVNITLPYSHTPSVLALRIFFFLLYFSWAVIGALTIDAGLKAVSRQIFPYRGMVS